MLTTTLTIVFRSLAILGGVLIGLFAYQIYQYSKGGMKGWKFLSIFGFSLFFWATTALITKLIGITLLERITGIIGLLAMAFFVPYAYTRLTDDLKLPGPRWVTGKVAIGYTSLVILILLGLNVFLPTFMSYPLDKMLSISHMTLGISLIFAFVPLWILVSHTKKMAWVIALAATVFLSFSLFVGQHYDGCCGKNGELTENDEYCGMYDLPYVQVTQMSCIGPIVFIGALYQAYLTIGILLLAFSYYELTRLFRKIMN
ncbi:MAG: hypothetical protein ACLFP2_03910 [Candidatus Woesearchaeota archaeon]